MHSLGKLSALHIRYLTACDYVPRHDLQNIHKTLQNNNVQFKVVYYVLSSRAGIEISSQVLLLCLINKLHQVVIQRKHISICTFLLAKLPSGDGRYILNTL
jgi:hypothetical protein